MISHILTLNRGSSSLKFALFEADKTLTRVLSGQFERIGLPNGKLTIREGATGKKEERELELADHAACVEPLSQLLDSRLPIGSLRAIGYRVVHGGANYSVPQAITPELIEELKRISPYDPEHLPAEIALIEAFATRYPSLPQIACFDTTFHRNMPRVAKLLPIPRRYFEQGVMRYGFHGLSYQYLMSELGREAGKAAARGRVILAHLGNGASMAAVCEGKSIDTTMGFTPTAGLVMSSRTGDLDPGLVAYLARTELQTADQFQHMVNAEAGLRGVSETSSDMRDLLAKEATDERAADAVALFCQSAKKWIGALAAELGGLDTLVFSGGIGENAAVIRARICDGLAFLGIELDSAHNAANDPLISSPSARVAVRVIRTDEEIQIAKTVLELTRL